MDAAGHDAKPFFIVGPLRTGSSLMARCIDDHPAAICLCESEINRALFRDYYVEHHYRRMTVHGLSLEQAIALLGRRKREDIESFREWYEDVTPLLCNLYGKYGVSLIGDKSPDFFRSPELVKYLASNFRLIYTVRDPRAILSSIESQQEATPAEKAERWYLLIENYLAWKPFLDTQNVLAVRYEDLVGLPETTMRSVYAHLGLDYSSRFLGTFRRPFPERFLWTTAVDWETGVRKEFDPGRVYSWLRRLSQEQVRRIRTNATVVYFIMRFGYEL